MDYIPTVWNIRKKCDRKINNWHLCPLMKWEGIYRILTKHFLRPLELHPEPWCCSEESSEENKYIYIDQIEKEYKAETLRPLQTEMAVGGTNNFRESEKNEKYNRESYRSSKWTDTRTQTWSIVHISVAHIRRISTC